MRHAARTGTSYPAERSTEPPWDELFPAEQGRIVRALAERVEVGPAGADIRLRVEGLAGLVRDLTMGKRGFIHRICADEEVEVYIVCPSTPCDRVYRWSSLRVGPEHVDEEIEGWPVGDEAHPPARR